MIKQFMSYCLLALSIEARNTNNATKPQEYSTLLHSMQERFGYSYGITVVILVGGLAVLLKMSRRVLKNVKSLISRTNNMIDYLEDNSLKLSPGEGGNRRLDRYRDNTDSTDSPGLMLEIFTDLTDGPISNLMAEPDLGTASPPPGEVSDIEKSIQDAEEESPSNEISEVRCDEILEVCYTPSK